MKKKNVAILGSGNIGSDLLSKVMRSKYLNCSLFIGQNELSPGILRAKSLGIPVSANSIDAIIEISKEIDIVFDATSATAHRFHAPILKKLNLFTIDLTPARVGIMCVPVLNLETALSVKNVNMISCGGQATAPLVQAIMKVHPDTEYVELVSSIASKSAGIGTRDNIDEYTETTAESLLVLGQAPVAKAIVILNPAEPPIMMHNTLYAVIKKPKLKQITDEITTVVKQMQAYIPGFHLTLEPIISNNRLTIMTEVTGQGDYLPVYAGNLDIINSAAIAVAEGYARKVKTL